MDKLKEQLEIHDLNWNDAHSKFKKIAENLMCDYIIKKGEKKYAIVEIEFYLYSNNHRDYITYPREIEAGRWFFHSSGVDLTFQSKGISLKYQYGKKQYTLQKDTFFGGILIRGLYKLDSNENDKYILGPQKCVNLLWDNFDALVPSNNEYPFIEPASNNDKIAKSNLRWCKRCINIKDEKRLNKISDWIYRLGINDITDKDKEAYKAKMFDNPDTQLYRFFNLQCGEDPCKFTKIPSTARPSKTFHL